MDCTDELLSFLSECRTHPDFLKNMDRAAWATAAKDYWAWKGREKSGIEIPKRIHQIWIGKAPPESVQRMMGMWQQQYPEHEYHLWSERELEQEELTNMKLFRKAKNPATKSDIARYELLHRYGGYYFDVDVEPIKDISTLGQGTSLLLCCHPCPHDGSFELGNAVIGGIADHPILGQVINRVGRIDDLDETDAVQIMRQTGPLMLTDEVNNTKKDNTIGILPSDYFYAWPSFMKDTERDPHTFTTNNSYALHHWNCSWMPHIEREKQRGRYSSRMKRVVREVLRSMHRGRP